MCRIHTNLVRHAPAIHKIHRHFAGALYYDDDVEALKVKITDTALSNVTMYRYLGIDLDRN